jgi:hypothetical protein
MHKTAVTISIQRCKQIATFKIQVGGFNFTSNGSLALKKRSEDLLVRDKATAFKLLNEFLNNASGINRDP